MRKLMIIVSLVIAGLVAGCASPGMTSAPSTPQNDLYFGPG